jgi:hypothetical protein
MIGSLKMLRQSVIELQRITFNMLYLDISCNTPIPYWEEMSSLCRVRNL